LSFAIFFFIFSGIPLAELLLGCCQLFALRIQGRY